MRRSRLIWYIFPWFIVIILGSLALVTVYSTRSARSFHFRKTAEDLEVRALLFEDVIDDALVRRPAAVDSICKSMGAATLTRLTVIRPDGTVIGDSNEDPARMGDHGDRPEVIRALAGFTGTSRRYSDTLREDLMYVAVPSRRDGRVVAAVRASHPLTELSAELRGLHTRVALSGLVTALVAVVISAFVARRISRPVDEIKRGVERFAMDDLGYRLPVHDLREIGGLASVINRMAERLEDRIRTVETQRNEQEAIFAGMVEGLIVLDGDENVVRMNPAAASFTGVDEEKARGRPIQEVIRNPYLLEFVSRTMRSNETVEQDFTLRNGRGEIHVQAHGVRLSGKRGARGGAVIVLNNVTRLRKLENLRRDFVANVSHELRTPITSIKGFVETLQDGALDDPVDSRHFLDIIARQADRMNNIIEDLLMLSGIERGLEREDVRLEPAGIRGVLEDAIRVCGSRAAERDIDLVFDAPDDLEAPVNEALMEQAVINLIDNAIKFSEPGSAIDVRAGSKDGEVFISVSDRGCGIEEEEIPRLFERFYRVDRSRGGKNGGTGLGLAIVKHIVQAHRGTVTVESAVGKGSTFTIRLPDRLS